MPPDTVYSVLPAIIWFPICAPVTIVAADGGLRTLGIALPGRHDTAACGSHLNFLIHHQESDFDALKS